MNGVFRLQGSHFDWIFSWENTDVTDLMDWHGFAWGNTGLLFLRRFLRISHFCFAKNTYPVSIKRLTKLASYLL